MKIRSWLATCATSTAAATDAAIPFSHDHRHQKSNYTYETALSLSPSSEPSSSSSSSASSNDTSSSSLQSNLSLQTLPSVPSLQLTPPPQDSLHLAAYHHLVSSLIPSTHASSPSLPITCLAPHGDLLYAASGHVIHAYDTSDGSFVHVDSFNDRAHSSGSVKSLAFSNGCLFSAHQDGKIRVWQFAAEKQHHSLVNTLPTVADRLLRFALPSNYVRVRRHRKRLWIEHSDAVTAMASFPGGGGSGARAEVIYSVSWDKSLKIWRGSDLRCQESVGAHDDAVNALAVAGDGTVYTGSADRRIRVWAKAAGEKRHSLVATLEKHKSAVNALALSDDGSVLFSGACDRSILVWEREDSANYMAVTGALRGHGKAILCLVNAGSLLMSGSADRTVRVWRQGADMRYCCLAVLEGHAKPVKSLAAVSDGEGKGGAVTVFSGSLDGEIRVWQVSGSNVSLSSSSPLKFD